MRTETVLDTIPWCMRMNFLDWTKDMLNYLTDNIEQYFDDSGVYPMFYKHNGITKEHVLEKAIGQTYKRGYDGLIPFIKHVVEHYAETRWEN